MGGALIEGELACYLLSEVETYRHFGRIHCLNLYVLSIGQANIRHVEHSSKMSVNFYHATPCHISETLVPVINVYKCVSVYIYIYM
jgi:hypothetical protein